MITTHYINNNAFVALLIFFVARTHLSTSADGSTILRKYLVHDTENNVNFEKKNVEKKSQ